MKALNDIHVSAESAANTLRIHGWLSDGCGVWIYAAGQPSLQIEKMCNGYRIVPGPIVARPFTQHRMTAAEHNAFPNGRWGGKDGV